MTSEFTPPNLKRSLKKNFENAIETEISPEDSFLYEAQKEPESPKEPEYLVDKVAAAKGISDLFTIFNYVGHTLQYKKGDNTWATYYTDPDICLQDALKQAARGFDVYFMVNEGDGIVHEGKKIPRSKDCVQLLSKCFIDTDKCPMEKFTLHLEDIGLTPHLIINSSPERYHIYFFINPIPTTNGNVAKWESVQDMLHRFGDHTVENASTTFGCDNTMDDHAKLLRVPGFYHVKKKHLVTIVKENMDPPYEFAYIFNKTAAQARMDYCKQTTGYARPSHVPTLEGPRVAKGDRWNSLRSLAMKIANEQLSDDEKISKFINFIAAKVDNDDFECLNANGYPTAQTKNLMQSALGVIYREEKKTMDEISNTAPLGNIPQPPKRESISVLPDSYFIDEAPNEFGKIITDVMGASKYPCACLAFGTFLAGLSIMKARSYFDPMGGSVALYVLNVAPSAHGKNDPMVLLKNTLVRLGVGEMIQSAIRSDQGMLNHLESVGSIGIFILDEISYLFKSIGSKSAASHESYMEKLILSLYSAGASKSESCGKIGSTNKQKGSKEIVLKNPMISVLGFTVPSQFIEMFSSASVLKGILPRFLCIVAPRTRSKFNTNNCIDTEINSPLFPVVVPQDARELDPFGDPMEDKDEYEVPKKSDKPKIPEFIRTTMGWEAGAREYYLEIVAKYEAHVDELNAGEDLARADLLGPIVSRCAENCLRIACTLSVGANVQICALKYAERFIEHNYIMTKKLVLSEFDRGDGSGGVKKRKQVMDAILVLMNQLGVRSLSKSQLLTKLQRDFDGDQLTKTLNQMHEMEEIVVNHYDLDKTKKPARPFCSIKLGEVL